MYLASGRDVPVAKAVASILFSMLVSFLGVALNADDGGFRL